MHNIQAFRRILERLKSHALVRPQQATDEINFKAQEVQRVKELFEYKPEAHIRYAVDALQLSYGTISIANFVETTKMESIQAALRFVAQLLGLANKESKLAAYNCRLMFTED